MCPITRLGKIEKAKTHILSSILRSGIRHLPRGSGFLLRRLGRARSRGRDRHQEMPRLHADGRVRLEQHAGDVASDLRQDSRREAQVDATPGPLPRDGEPGQVCAALAGGHRAHSEDEAVRVGESQIACRFCMYLYLVCAVVGVNEILHK